MNGSDLGVRSLNPRAGCRDCLMTTNKPSVHSCRSAGGLHARHRRVPLIIPKGRQVANLMDLYLSGLTFFIIKIRIKLRKVVGRRVLLER